MSWAMKAWVPVGLLLIVGGCATPEAIPEPQYYRLAPLRPITPAAVARPVVLYVDQFGADGVYAERPLVYALDEDAIRVKQYHYQYWLDSPTRLVTRRLLQTLRERAPTVSVVDRLPRDDRTWRIQGRLTRFDRVRGADGWTAVVEMDLRVEVLGSRQMLQSATYRESVSADGDRVTATAQAFSIALDAINERFLQDLERLLATRTEPPS